LFGEAAKTDGWIFSLVRIFLIVRPLMLRYRSSDRFSIVY